MLELENVSKSYGPVRALDGLSLCVGRDEIVAMLGPNGAGKTTAIEIALGLRAADGGSVRLFGMSPRDPRVRVRVGATPQESGFPDALRVEELIAFAAAHYPDAAPAGETLEAFGLRGLARRRAGELSGGESRRVALALAFAGRPDLVVLDEPTTGLDVESRLRLWHVVREAARGRSILFTTHYLEEAEALATRIVVIDAGRALFDGSAAGLRDRFGTRRVSYVDETNIPVVANAVDSDAYVRDLVISGRRFSQLEVVRPSLEEAFLAMTGGPK